MAQDGEDIIVLQVQPGDKPGTYPTSPPLKKKRFHSGPSLKNNFKRAGAKESSAIK